ncbi:MAG: LysE family transporter [Bacteroidota bacterium]
MELTPIVQGILAGMVIALMLGPAFFIIIRTSIEKGFRYGALFASGVFLSDALILFTVFMGMSAFYESILFRRVFSIIGGALLLGIGIYYMRSKIVADCRNKTENMLPDKSHFLTYPLKGFLLNILSPTAFLLWIGIVGTTQVNFSFGPNGNFLFFASTLSTMLILDMGKAYLADKLSAWFGGKNLTLLNQGFGLIMILISFRLIFFFFFPEAMV